MERKDLIQSMERKDLIQSMERKELIQSMERKDLIQSMERKDLITVYRCSTIYTCFPIDIHDLGSTFHAITQAPPRDGIYVTFAARSIFLLA